VPLLSAVAASNEGPESEELSALYDRFLLRKLVAPVSDDGVLELLMGTDETDAAGEAGARATADETRGEAMDVDGLREALEAVRAALVGVQAEAQAAAEALEAVRPALDALCVDLVPKPPGERQYTLPPLTTDEEALVDAALGPGRDDEMLADYKNIPITRQDMATLKPHEWLNDEVINFFFKLLEEREAYAVASAAGGGEPHVTAEWPRF